MAGNSFYYPRVLKGRSGTYNQRRPDKPQKDLQTHIFAAGNSSRIPVSWKAVAELILGGERMNEKAYKTMTQVGAGNLAIGIILLTVGLVTGILTIVNGGRLLKNKSDLMF